MPHFVVQRSLYEVRERPSKVYGWKVFMLSQIIVELPWNTLMAALMYFCWYYPVGLQANAAAAGQTVERGGLMFLLLVAFLLFTSTFTDFIIAGFETAEAGGNIANLLFSLCLIFCGVLATPATMPRFWIFMYRVSPFTYLVSAMLSTAVANTDVFCAPNEMKQFFPPDGMTCGDYLANYMSAYGGYLVDSNTTQECSYCTVSKTNTFLLSVGSSYDDRWRNFGYVSCTPPFATDTQIANVVFKQHPLGLHRLQRLRRPGSLLACQSAQEEAWKEEAGISHPADTFILVHCRLSSLCFPFRCLIAPTAYNARCISYSLLLFTMSRLDSKRSWWCIRLFGDIDSNRFYCPTRANNLDSSQYS